MARLKSELLVQGAGLDAEVRGAAGQGAHAPSSLSPRPPSWRQRSARCAAPPLLPLGAGHLERRTHRCRRSCLACRTDRPDSWPRLSGWWASTRTGSGCASSARWTTHCGSSSPRSTPTIRHASSHSSSWSTRPTTGSTGVRHPPLATGWAALTPSRSPVVRPDGRRHRRAHGGEWWWGGGASSITVGLPTVPAMSAMPATKRGCCRTRARSCTAAGHRRSRRRHVGAARRGDLDR